MRLPNFFTIGKPISPDFTIYTGDQGQNRSSQWSSSDQKLYKNLFVLGRTPLGELTALPRPPSWYGGGSHPSPQETHPVLAAIRVSARHLPAPGINHAGFLIFWLSTF